MRYDLVCRQCGLVFMIQCSWDKRMRLRTCEDVKSVLTTGEVEFQPDQEIDYEEFTCNGEVETDYRTQQPIRHNINWPRTEDTK